VGARYCHACGVAVAAGATGEFELYDLDRFFNFALDMLSIAGVDGYFKRVNPAFQRTLGYTAEELLQIPFVDLIHPDDRAGTMAEVGKLQHGVPTLSFENRYRCKDGSYRDLHWTSYPEQGTGLLYAIARDVTDWKRHIDRTDQLTRVATRRVFEEMLPREWNRSCRLELPIALAIIDVDDFRDYNVRCGYDAGDDCLRQVGRVLLEHARRAGDLAARYGGQEFALLVQGGVSSAMAGTLCDRIRAAVQALAIPHEGASAGPHVTISAGVAVVVPPRDSDHRSIIAVAEQALSEAKQQGRNRVVQAPSGR